METRLQTKKHLNDIMHQCFCKKKIQKDKKLFDRETRELIKAVELCRDFCEVPL